VFPILLLLLTFKSVLPSSRTHTHTHTKAKKFLAGYGKKEDCNLHNVTENIQSLDSCKSLPDHHKMPYRKAGLKKKALQLPVRRPDRVTE
jgi:hypothetical protein